MLARISLSPKLNEATVIDSWTAVVAVVLAPVVVLELVLVPPPELHAAARTATTANIAPMTPLRCNRMGLLPLCRIRRGDYGRCRLAIKQQPQRVPPRRRALRQPQAAPTPFSLVAPCASPGASETA